jgi:hypothetical protein
MTPSLRQSCGTIGDRLSLVDPPSSGRRRRRRGLSYWFYWKLAPKSGIFPQLEVSVGCPMERTCGDRGVSPGEEGQYHEREKHSVSSISSFGFDCGGERRGRLEQRLGGTERPLCHVNLAQHDMRRRLKRQRSMFPFSVCSYFMAYVGKVAPFLERLVTQVLFVSHDSHEGRKMSCTRWILFGYSLDT